MTRNSLTAIIVAFLVSGASAQAHEVKAGDLVLTNLWSRATPNGAKVGGGYLTIENKGAAPDRLVSVASAKSQKAEIHEMAMANGVMTMRPLDAGLAIEPGKTVTLAPGGLHLMFMDIKAPLTEGEDLPVVLQFEKAGKVETVLHVRAVGAKGPADAKGTHTH